MAMRKAKVFAGIIVLILLPIVVHGISNEANLRPIIGILSQPGDPAPEGESYIAASYVKWLESAGARVVPIFYDMDAQDIERRFAVINGLLLPGGGATLEPGHRFYDTARYLVELALKANDNGDYFPVHGTCLGMETLSVIISSNYTLLGEFDAEDAPAPLLYTNEAAASHLLRSLPPDVVTDLQNKPIAMENHMNGGGLSMTAFLENPALGRFFRVVSLSLDKSGAAYISTLEGRNYPFTATQWHPEKNAYEWTPHLHIPHTTDAIRMSQEVANFFVAEARRNLHMAKNIIEEDELLIYNFKPVFTGKHEHEGEERDFEQSYFFKKISRGL
ncbi:hypothetical protein VOLCADRAFT_102798 [Volvox carteri f. nagariensis]|uniref:folate gamma-glutamyl hydrolase n=1 Tax=Volvox carteri f. nagariensis TaxID=3068 RepID=D8TI61_VOLCA|nr:uncharacterized protein VOLCADRAFT_102798 [Volvox carteri f. nagariensis]EFJ53180.1 hypothetical protein VOLCADRAFT_102798 [Volvox carteri f. nagariensis]|eukprot:XP_002946185.1 hypothetical protein VOLCADRAFT_102798 [Volvox carteri f. nagariensis]